MELPLNDHELKEIIHALHTSHEDDDLCARLELIQHVREENPQGPWKAILRTQYNMCI